MTYHNICVTQNQYCPECGTINPIDATYCGGCGAQLRALKSFESSPQQSNVVVKDQGSYQPPQNLYDPSSSQSYFVNDPNYGSPQNNQNNRNFPNYSQPPNYLQQNQNNYEHRTYGFRPLRKDPALAVILTIFFPGAAHMYTDKVFIGIVYTFLTYFMYAIFVGFIMHLYFIFTASERIKRFNRIMGYPE